MKTNSSLSRGGNLRVTVVCLVIVALASFDLWASGYCYRNHATASQQQTITPLVLHGSPARSVMFRSF
jgi:hypothetical protein